LIDHVAKKCSVLSKDEREDFLARYQQSRPAQPRRANGEAVEAVASTSAPDVSALNTLAEVSRQHSHMRSSPTRDSSQATQPAESSTFLDQLRENVSDGYPQAMSPEAAVKASLGNLIPDSNDRKVTSAAGPSTTPAGAQQDTPTSNVTVGSASAALQMTALSALDPMLEHYTNLPITLVEYAVPTRAQPVNDPKRSMSTFSVAASPQKKVRGAFSEPRRLQVRNVRSKGACMRCRMLKKCCGEEDPCTECSKLENARLWKGACIRVRLTELFTVYQSCLFRVVAHHAEQVVKQPGQHQIMTGRLEITHFPDSLIYLTAPWITTTAGVVLLNNESDTVSDRMKGYIFKVLARNNDTKDSVFQVSRFIHFTLRHATDMCDGSQVRNSYQSKYRACSLTQIQDSLLAKALELWVCTYLMTNKQSNLQAYINLTEPPTEGAIVIAESEGHQREDISKSTNPYSMEIINKQLNSAAERRAGLLSKSIMKELEHQLIARKQSNKAELFITALLLLLAAERICCFIKRYDTVVAPTKPATATGGPNIDPALAPLVDFNNTPLEQTNGRTRWPLEKGPEHFWQQGEQFSNVLTSMLKLRLVTPKMVIEEDGYIYARVEEEAEVKGWLNDLLLTMEKLEGARQKPFDADDESFWELKWASKPFLS